MPPPPSDPSMPPITRLSSPIPLPIRTHTCWFSAILSRTPTHFIYAISFREKYPFEEAWVRIPESFLTRTMVRIWEEQNPPDGQLEIVRVGIERNEKTKGVAEIGEMVGEEEGEGGVVRTLRVFFDERVFSGEVHMPRDEDIARPSIEPSPPSPPPRRTVVFTTSPAKGRTVEVEIWSLDGRSYLSMSAKVIGLERKERRVVMIRARIPETQEWVDLKGDLDLDARHKVARCVEVGERRGWK